MGWSRPFPYCVPLQSHMSSATDRRIPLQQGRGGTWDESQDGCYQGRWRIDHLVWLRADPRRLVLSLWVQMSLWRMLWLDRRGREGHVVIKKGTHGEWDIALLGLVLLRCSGSRIRDRIDASGPCLMLDLYCPGYRVILWSLGDGSGVGRRRATTLGIGV